MDNHINTPEENAVLLLECGSVAFSKKQSTELQLYLESVGFKYVGDSPGLILYEGQGDYQAGEISVVDLNKNQDLIRWGS